MKRIRKTLTLAVLFFIILAASVFASIKDDVKKGNLLYNKGQFAEAAKAYQEALAKDPSSGIASFNLGTAKYKNGSLPGAVENFNGAIGSAEAPLIPPADYNIANSQYRMGLAAEKSDDVKKAKDLYETALKFYKRSMDLDPYDKDAKFNYEFVEKKLNELAEKYQFKKDEKKDDQKDNKNNKDNKKQDQKDNKDQKKDDKKDQQQDKKEDQKKDQEKNQDKNQDQDQQQDKQQQDKQQQEEKEKQSQEKNKSQEQSQSGDNKPSQGAGGEGEEQKGGESKDESEKNKEEKSKEEEKPQGAGGEENNPEQGQGEEEKKPEQSQGSEENKPGEAGQEDKKEPQAAAAAGASGDKKDKSEQGGLQAYQSPGSEGQGIEMSEQEAKMLLEGYKGEEATGMSVRMRQKHIDMPEPTKDW